MLRILKILLIAALLAGIYFYLQQTPFITTTWPRADLGRGASLAFPVTARHYTRNVHSPLFGITRLDINDVIDTNEAYICLRITPQYDSALHKNLEQLIDHIRQLNDTDGLPISLRQQFIYQGYPVYEYHVQDKGQRLWVRIVKLNDGILSLMYVVKGESLSEHQASNFFNSLTLR
jgi:hypothetical protein